MAYAPRMPWHSHCSYLWSDRPQGGGSSQGKRRVLMKRLSSWTACLAFVFALSSLTSSVSARTSVSVDLHFGDRYRGPDVVFYDEPDVVVVPGTRVYYVRWYRARNYRGPWIYVGYRSVPRDVGYVPYRYRRHWREFREEPRYTYR